MTGVIVNCLCNIIIYSSRVLPMLYSQVTVAVDVTVHCDQVRRRQSTPSPNKKCQNHCVSWVLWKDTKDGSPPLQPHLKTRIWSWLLPEVYSIISGKLSSLSDFLNSTRQDNYCMATDPWGGFLRIPKKNSYWPQPFRLRRCHLFWWSICLVLFMGPYPPSMGPEHWLDNPSFCRAHFRCPLR